MKVSNRKKIIDIKVSNQRDKAILDKAFCLLDNLGYIICKKDSLILNNSIKR
jgi:hypothetical protein